MAPEPNIKLELKLNFNLETQSALELVAAFDLVPRTGSEFEPATMLDP